MMETFEGKGEKFVPKAFEETPYPVEKAVAYIEAHKEPVDYQKIWELTTPILFLGESSHIIASSKEEIIAHMPTFKQLGATHLAMEMIRDDQQEIVDAFLTGDLKESGHAFIRLYRILEKDWSWTSDAVELWLNMMRRAKRLGMKIVGIDKNMGDDDIDETLSMQERNIHWAGILKGILDKEPSAHIVVHHGAQHCGYQISPTSVNELLQAEGIASTVVAYIGGEKVRRKFGEREISKVDTDTNFALAAQQAKIDRQKFALNLSSFGHTRPADYFIHLPQVEPPSLIKVLLDRPFK